MSRQAVRDLKRAVRTGSRAGADGGSHVLAKESALALLARSVRFGHSRLAVVRLAMAVRAGADVPCSHWDYCRGVVAAAKDPALQALFAEAGSAGRIHTAH